MMISLGMIASSCYGNCRSIGTRLVRTSLQTRRTAHTTTTTTMSANEPALSSMHDSRLAQKDAEHTDNQAPRK